MNPPAAVSLGHALLDAAEALAFLPYRGPAMRGRPQFRKLAHPPHHVIIYQVNEQSRTVEILRFWDARQNPGRLQLP
jgi:plasmid stabilization system protein ParE